MVDYVIPANDDAIRAVKLITGVMANAVVEANGGKIVEYVKEEDKKGDNAKEIMERALETVKRKEPRRFDNKKPSRPFERRNNDNKKSFENKTEVKEQPKEENVTVTEEKAIDYDKMTVAELREIAKSKEVKGYSTMKKAELIEALR